MMSSPTCLSPLNQNYIYITSQMLWPLTTTNCGGRRKSGNTTLGVTSPWELFLRIAYLWSKRFQNHLISEPQYLFYTHLMPFLMFRDNDSGLRPSAYPYILERALNEYIINTSVTIYYLNHQHRQTFLDENYVFWHQFSKL